MSKTEEPNVKFLAVARSRDKVVVASYTNGGRADEHLSSVKQVLSAPGWAAQVGPSAKLHLDNGPNTFHLMTDERERVFIAITVSSYPRRFVFSSSDGAKQGVLGELKEDFVAKFDDASMTASANGLTKQASKLLAAVCNKYDDLRSIDKISNIRAKVDEGTEPMQENISIVLATAEAIDKIEWKTEVLSTSAQRFSKKSTQLRKAMQWRYYKLQALIALIILVVLGYILIPIITDMSADDGSS